MKNYNKYICAFVLLVGMSVNAWGVDVVFNQANTSIGSYSTSESTIDIDDFTFGYKNLMLNTKNSPTGWGSVLVQFKKNATDYGQLYNKTEFNNLQKIRIYAQNSPDLTVYTSSSIITSKPGSGGTTLSSATGSETVTYTTNTDGTSTTTMSYYDITPSSGDKYFYICNNNSSATYVFKVVVTYLNKFTVTYDGNGKDGGGAAPTDASSPYNPNSTVTVLGNVNSMTRTGYTFNGWNTLANGTGSPYAAGATFTITENTTLFAQWSLNSHTLAVASVDNVVISATTPSVAEGSSTSRNYGTTVTLSHGAPDGGRQWGGWKVYKTGDASTTVSVDGNNQFTMPDYNVTVSANLYADFRFSCAELTLTPKLVTAGTPIFITSAASKTVRSQDSILIVGNGLTPNTALTFPDLPSKFAIKSRTGGTLQTDASGEINAVAYIYYTPGSGDTSDGLDKLTGITVSVGGAKPKTVVLEQDIIGRHLPADFVIAAKRGGKWYALPDTMTGTWNPKPVEIAVDDIDNPTIAYTATTNVYNLYGQVSETIGGQAGYLYSNGHTIKLGMKNNATYANYPLFGSATEKSTIGKGGTATSVTNNIGKQYWWVLTQTNTSIENAQDAKYSIKSANNTAPLILKENAGNPQWGFFITGSVGPIRLIPASDITFTEAYFVEWGQHGGVIEVDATGIDATSVVAHLNGVSSSAITLVQTKASDAKNKSSKYNYTVNFGGSIDFAAAASNGALLTLEWKNGETVKAVSNIVVPKIVASDITINKANYTNKSDWNTEVHVLPGKTVTVDPSAYDGSNVTIKELNIYPGATVVASTGTLIATNLVLRNGWSRAGTKTYDVARLYVTPSPSTATLKATNVYADWYIDYDQYYPIAVPWNATVANFTYRYCTVSPTVGHDKNIRLRYYDGASRATNVQEGVGSGANWKLYGADGCASVPTTLTPSTGYAMTAKRPTGKAFSIIRMPLTLPSGTWGDGTWTTNGETGNISTTHKDQVAVTAYGVKEKSETAYAEGWNFIANPYMSIYTGALSLTPLEGAATTVKVVNIPDVDFKEYDQLATETAKLKPASAFLIQAPATGTVTFGTANRKASAPSFRMEEKPASIPEQQAYIVLNGESVEDMMGLFISDKYTAEYDLNGDVEKLLSNSNSLRTYMRYADRNMAYVAINEMLAKEWIPVNVRLPEAGEYTFSLHEASKISELEGIYLIDYESNTVTNLIEDNYSFVAAGGTIADRFAINVIVGKHNTPTDIDIINAGGDINSKKPVKFIWDDKVFILHNGVIYDSTGKRVREINR